MGLESSAEQPLPVRTVSRSIGEWVGRLGRVWVEGQVTQVNRRPGTVFLTLRDPVADVSLSVTCGREVCDVVQPPLAEGARVVVFAKPSFYLGRGTLSLAATEIRPVGVGELLARIERLKQLMQAEGLFARERKRPLPFLPGVVGLVTGRASAAERDVLEVARRRWPAVRFDVRHVAVQGHLAVQQCVEAVRSLDGACDVIVVARGGGSVEDLLPFSDEALCRAVAACRTPVVSAIGHEPDSPLLDLVADLRCATPTDAAKQVVPDVAEEAARVRQLRDRARRVVVGTVERERSRLDAVRSRPALADPASLRPGPPRRRRRPARARLPVHGGAAGPGAVGAVVAAGPRRGAQPAGDPRAGLRGGAAGRRDGRARPRPGRRRRAAAGAGGGRRARGASLTTLPRTGSPG